MTSISLPKAPPRTCNGLFNMFSAPEFTNLEFCLEVALNEVNDEIIRDGTKFNLMPKSVLENLLHFACHHGEEEGITIAFSTSPTFKIKHPQKAEITNEGFCLTEVGFGNFWSKVKTPTVLFSELAKVMSHEMKGAYEPHGSIVCTWYGGVLFYAAPGRLEKLIERVCAERPDIAARQLQFDMTTRITQGLTTSIGAISPCRSRMQL